MIEDRAARGAILLFVATVGASCASTAHVADRVASTANEPAVSEFARLVEGLEARAGLIELYVDGAHGRLLAAFPPPSGPRGEIDEFLLVEALRSGLGSNPVGLDRGQLGSTERVVLRSVGGRVLVEIPNLRFRALSRDPDESLAVRESFATSVLWAGEILARDGSGRLLVDLTSFALRDAHGVGSRLARSEQGSYSLDRERSVVDLGSCHAFPDNVEIESLLTFAGSSPGSEVLSVAPDASSVSLILHQSLTKVPDPGYRPRELDPRMGSFGIELADYSAPLDRPIGRRWIARHRLEKTDPEAVRSPVTHPIVYYVDRAAPEPVRSALVEGASWWARAFEAAGFEDAFRVELLPEEANPLDLRYNVVQWVHRATRGWSYGGGVIDPLTGEIVKGHVSLGSLRVRQDQLLLEGLVGTEWSGRGGADDPIQLALARIRQLAAHEVGHTLGLAHNFAASTRARASVMDYPAPWVRITPRGELDLSDAYSVGVGAWDIAAIRWAYSEPPPGVDETEFLDAILRETLAQDLIFLSDSDARPPGAAQPWANLWDNGADPVAALEETIRVRQIALQRFGARNIRPGAPLAELEEVLATVYLHHRYQLVAAAKALGGIDYRHALRGDGQPPARAIGAEAQRRALALLLQTLAPDFLDLPESALRVLPPRLPGIARSREQFGSRTGPGFDALGAAATAADLALRALLEPSRAARLVDQNRRDPALPGLLEVLDRTTARVFADTTELAPRRAEIARVVQRVLVEHLLALSADEEAAPWVRSRVDAVLSDLLQGLDDRSELDRAERAHLAFLAAEIGRHLARPAETRTLARSALPEPPGEPIGQGSRAELSGCGFEAPLR